MTARTAAARKALLAETPKAMAALARFASLLSASLADEMMEEAESIRNKRTMDTTAFQNFDQKANQVFNMLASVIKTMNEMRSIGAASRSGL